MYDIRYHLLVLSEDLSRIARHDQRRILRTILKKLQSHPHEFGKPLGSDLQGYYRLRIDPYRVVYRIEGQRILVFVLAIGMRRNSEIYKKAAQRLGLV